MAGISADEIVEHTLAQIHECYLFHLPPRVRAQGWLAADMTKQMWTGRMRIVQRGLEAAVMLVDRRDGKLFAVCKVEDGAVERVPDSSRYFVIKIMNSQGRHAFVGLAFDDRNQAFDFNVALQEFKKDVERSKMLADGKVDEEETSTALSPASSLSLKEGEKIRINLGGKPSTTRLKKTSGLGGTGGFTLAPPPGDTTRKTGLGGGRLLVPPPGDTRRARPAVSRPAAPAPAASPDSGSTARVAVSSDTDLSAGFHSGGVATGGRADSGLGMGAVPSVMQTVAAPQGDDNDLLGLGLGPSNPAPTPMPPSSGTSLSPHGSEFLAPASQPPRPAGSEWGLADMSGLHAGLPAPQVAGGGSVPDGSAAPGLPRGSSGLSAQPQQQPLQQPLPQGSYSQDPFNPQQPQAYPGGDPWMQKLGPSGPVASTSGGTLGSSAPPAATSDDPFGGLF